MKKKLFISDIDGTLLKTGQLPHPMVPDAIKRFCESGGMFALCTGRALPAVQGVVSLLPPCAPCILCSGAMIYDFRENRILESHFLEPEIFPFLERVLASEPDVSVTVSTMDSIFRIRDNQRLLTKGVYEDRTAPKANLRDVGPLLKVMFTCDDPAVLEAISNACQDTGKFEMHRASTHFYELTALGINKSAAVKRLKELLGCDCAFCAGDAPSDLIMASEAEAFFAPETAMDLVKNCATRTFPAPDKGGLAWALMEALEWGGI